MDRKSGKPPVWPTLVGSVGLLLLGAAFLVAGLRVDQLHPDAFDVCRGQTLGVINAQVIRVI